MRTRRRNRGLGRGWPAAALLLLVGGLPGVGQHGQPQPHANTPAPYHQVAPQTSAPRPGNPQAQSQTPVRGQHLPEWMQNHQGQNSQQKEQALRREPGFNRLPGPQQQQLIDRLHKLDSAPPQVRQRILQRNEIFERMAPEQKQQIRASSQALGQMPPDRNMAVRHAFRDMRALSPNDRINVLNSARFQAEFSPEERQVLGHLLSIEPYRP